MKKIIVELVFDEKDLGENWINPDSLNLLLYSKNFTEKDLLKVASYKESDVGLMDILNHTKDLRKGNVVPEKALEESC